MTASPLRWHGGKSPIARKIVELLPPCMTYVEAYAGGLSVLLARPASTVRAEVVNDLDGGLYMFWSVLRDPEKFQKFAHIIEMTPICERIYEEARQRMYVPEYKTDIAWAVDFFIVCRQSLAGRMESFTPLTRSRLRRGMNGEVSAWWSAVDGLQAVHDRLARVVVMSKGAIHLIDDMEHPETLFYLDPPYLPETRVAAKVYSYEMTHAEHEELLQRLQTVQGMVALSGYSSDLYDQYLGGWRKHTFDVATHSAAAGQEKSRRTEVLWMNYKEDGTRL